MFGPILYSLSISNSHSVSHRNSPSLSLFALLVLSLPSQILVHQEMALIEDDENAGAFNAVLYDSGFFYKIALGKENVMTRKNKVVDMDMLKTMVANARKDKRSFSNEEVGTAMVDILGKNVNTLPVSTLMAVLVKLEIQPKWAKLVKSLMVGEHSKGHMAKELSCLWNLFQSLKTNWSSDWKFKGNIMTPHCVMYLIDRVAVLAAAWKQADYFYSTKSATVEWLLHENIAKYSNLGDTSVLTTGLELIKMFLHQFFAKYTVSPKAKDLRHKWAAGGRRTYPLMKVEEGKRNLVLWLTVATCVLNLNTDFEYNDFLEKLLKNEEIQAELPQQFLGTLMGGFSAKTSIKMKIKAIADALALIQNPLVIVELKSNPTERKTAPTSSIFLSNRLLQNRELSLLQLYPAEMNLGENIAGTSSKKQKITDTGAAGGITKEPKKKAVGMPKKKAIDWMKMRTDFQLDRIEE